MDRDLRQHLRNGGHRLLAAGFFSNLVAMSAARDVGRDSKGRGMGTRRTTSSLAATLLAGLSVVACSGDQAGVRSSEDARIRRPTEIVLERCATEGEGVEKLDANADGKPEVTRQMDGQREVCRVSDLNFDGKPDRTSYFDEAGKIRRVETDFDRDGRVDEIASYKAGVLTERHRATTLGGKLDTWEFYEAGKLARTERDENGDGIIDQWWEYPTVQCPLIHSDTDGDGRPDPSATIDYCKTTGYVPPPPPDEATSKAPGFDAETNGGPLELNNVAADAASGGNASGGAPKASGEGTGGAQAGAGGSTVRGGSK